MQVKELIKLLETFNPEDRVAVEAGVGHVTLGGRPRAEIESVIGGFDWDHGVVFLHPKEGTNLLQITREEFRGLIEWKQLVSGLRGKGDVEEAKKEFIRREDLRSLLSGIILKHFGPVWYPSCEESIFQCDTPLIESPSVVCEIMTEFGLFKSKEEEV